MCTEIIDVSAKLRRKDENSTVQVLVYCTSVAKRRLCCWASVTAYYTDDVFRIELFFSQSSRHVLILYNKYACARSYARLEYYSIFAIYSVANKKKKNYLCILHTYIYIYTYMHITFCQLENRIETFKDDGAVVFE